jgi:hypothetical protein
MSAIASFVQIPVSAIDGLREAAVPKKRWIGAPKDRYWEFLRVHGRETAEYRWSGYVYNTLLLYLEETHGINVTKSEYDELAEFLTKARHVSHAVLTPALRDAYVNRLDPELFPAEEMIAYHDEFTGRDEGNEYLIQAMKDGIVALRQSLSQLEDGYITLFIIG